MKVFRNGEHRALGMALFRRFVNNKFNPTKDYYKILEVNKSAAPIDIKKSYYNLVKKYHPDKGNSSEDKIKEVNEAYGILSDEKIRKEYDSARNFTSNPYSSYSNQQNHQRTSYQSNYNQQRTSYQTSKNHHQDPFQQQYDSFKNFYQQNSGRPRTGQYYKKTGIDQNGNPYDYWEYRSASRGRNRSSADQFNNNEGVNFNQRAFTQEDFDRIKEDFFNTFYQSNQTSDHYNPKDTKSAKNEESWNRSNEFRYDHHNYERIQREKEEKAVQEFKYKIEDAKEALKDFRDEWKENGVWAAVKKAYLSYKHKSK